ncbi:hypothetical protein AVEN_33692-1 [Araneus ventricosus]|uniref:Uncharacterized protein n=1 Tax=Araneus ventricosus TaxID=182803 RepID=A0A4Y2R9I8_ARAVE|nr:hypothetical protein AVEN_33692-1 [Araneus ventricosus]
MGWLLKVFLQAERKCEPVSLETLPGSCDLAVRSSPRGEEVPGSKPDSTEDPPCKQFWGTLNLKSWVKILPAGVVRKFGEGGASSGVVLFL